MGVPGLPCQAPRFCAVSLLSFILVACGGGGGGAEDGSDPPPNQPPVANAGTDQTIVEGNSVTLSAAASTDADGSIASYSWTQTEGPAIVLQGADNAQATFEPPLTNTDPVSLSFELTVTDNDGATDTASTNVTVEPSEPPVVAAGSDFQAVERETVTLDSTTTDPDNTVAAWSWIQTAGPAVTLANAETEDASFTAPAVSDITELEFELTATDSSGDAASDTVKVTVNPNEPPNLAVHFPCDGCRFFAGDTISVTGSVDAGVDNAYVTSVDGISVVTVDAGAQAIDAVVEADGRWIAANVPLPSPTALLSLNITATDLFGESDSLASGLERQPTLTSVLVAHDPVTSDLLYLFDDWTTYQRLLSVDLNTGTWTRIYDSGSGAQAIRQPINMVIDQGSTRAIFNDIASVNGVAFGIVAIDLNTGAPVPVSDSTLGSGPTLSRPWDMALDTDDQSLVVYDRTLQALFLIDPATGDRTIVSDNAGTGSGPAFISPDAISVDSANDLAVLREGANTFITVDLTTGDRVASVASGPFMNIVRSMDFDPQRSLVTLLDPLADETYTVPVPIGAATLHSAGASQGGFETLDAIQIIVDEVSDRYIINDFSDNISEIDTDRLLSVDPETGSRSVILDDWRGSGPAPEGQATLALDADNGVLFLAGEESDDIVRVDVETGDRQLVADSTTGTGPAFDTIRDIALDSAAGRLLVVDEVTAAVIAVDPATGNRSVLSDAATGTGPAFDAPVALAVDPVNGVAFVADDGLQAVLSVDLETGNRTVVSDSSNSGSPLENPTALVLDPLNNRLLVTEEGEASAAQTEVIAVDLSTGDRTTVAGFAIGDAAFFISARDIALIDNTEFALVAAGSQIYKVDLTSGAKPILANSDIGSGEDFSQASSLAYDAAKGVVYTWDFVFEAVFAFDASTGDRVVVSK